MYLKLKMRQFRLERLYTMKTDQEMLEDENLAIECDRIIDEINDIQLEYDNVLFRVFYGLQQRQEQKDM